MYFFIKLELIFSSLFGYPAEKKFFILKFPLEVLIYLSFIALLTVDSLLPIILATSF